MGEGGGGKEREDNDASSTSSSTLRMTKGSGSEGWLKSPEINTSLVEILSELVKRIEFKKILPWQGQRISQPKILLSTHKILHRITTSNITAVLYSSIMPSCSFSSITVPFSNTLSEQITFSEQLRVQLCRGHKACYVLKRRTRCPIYYYQSVKFLKSQPRVQFSSWTTAPSSSGCRRSITPWLRVFYCFVHRQDQTSCFRSSRDGVDFHNGWLPDTRLEVIGDVFVVYIHPIPHAT